MYSLLLCFARVAGKEGHPDHGSSQITGDDRVFPSRTSRLVSDWSLCLYADDFCKVPATGGSLVIWGLALNSQS